MREAGRREGVALPSTREVLRELGALLPQLSPDDQQRVLDRARRLAR